MLYATFQAVKAMLLHGKTISLSRLYCFSAQKTCLFCGLFFYFDIKP